jgi:dephospho-CoA kinase
MIVIGLTGSIGTGKSTIARQFARLGAATLDSDKVVHALLAKGGEAVEEVARLFPAARVNGAIDRKLLGREVFGKPVKLKLLESVIHPLVRKAQDEFIRKSRRAVRRFVVLDIPLLFETEGEKRCDYVVVTDASPFLQRQRVLARPGMTEEKFTAVVAAQMPAFQKRRRADFVICTGLGRYVSQKEVKRILCRLNNGYVSKRA